MFNSAVKTLYPYSLALLLMIPGWIGGPAPSHATLTPQLSLDELTRAADVIVIATATQTETVWIDGELITHVNLDIETTLSGESPEPIELLVPGGVDADRRIPVASVIPGQPRILVGERYLLFLRRLQTAPPYYSLTGDAQGLFLLIPGAPQSPMAVRDLSTARLLTPDGVTHGRTTAVPVDRLVTHLRTLLASHGR